MPLLCVLSLGPTGALVAIVCYYRSARQLFQILSIYAFIYLKYIQLKYNDADTDAADDNYVNDADAYANDINDADADVD